MVLCFFSLVSFPRFKVGEESGSCLRFVPAVTSGDRLERCVARREEESGAILCTPCSCQLRYWTLTCMADIFLHQAHQLTKFAFGDARMSAYHTTAGGS